jgi:hypothetical protein
MFDNLLLLHYYGYIHMANKDAKIETIHRLKKFVS